MNEYLIFKNDSTTHALSCPPPSPKSISLQLWFFAFSSSTVIMIFTIPEALYESPQSCQLKLHNRALSGALPQQQQ